MKALSTFGNTLSQQYNALGKEEERDASEAEQRIERQAQQDATQQTDLDKYEAEENERRRRPMEK